MCLQCPGATLGPLDLVGPTQQIRDPFFGGKIHKLVTLLKVDHDETL